MMMNPKTIVNKILVILLLQISYFSIVVFSMEAYASRDHYKWEYAVKPDTVVNVVFSNELYGLKNGSAGFVCDHGPKVWRKSKPGDRYVLLRFKYDGKIRFKFIHCHLRSKLGFVNFPVSIHPDTSAHCYPSYICRYSIRKDGVYYKPEKKLYRWYPLPRRLPKA